MNKRIKKKRAMEQRIRFLEDEINRQDFVIENLIDHIGKSDKMIDANYQVMTDNVKATNERFTKLESENKALKADLKKGILEFKQAKKPFWKR